MRDTPNYQPIAAPKRVISQIQSPAMPTTTMPTRWLAPLLKYFCY